jgi:arsenate reductase-like glutaredoxin family protein
VKKARFFWRSTCSTCRNAREFLRSELKVDLEERDYAKEPFTAAELREVFAGHDPRDFLNPKSASLKARGIDPRALSAQAVLKLMVEDSRVIKRPLTMVGKRMIAGFDKDALRDAFE